LFHVIEFLAVSPPAGGLGVSHWTTNGLKLKK
jgi:hypothetical protein